MIFRVVYDLFREAAQNFLGKDVSEIQAIAHHTLEGHQRSIMGKMTVEEILQNKQKFGEEVFEIATVGMDDLLNQTDHKLIYLRYLCGIFYVAVLGI